MKIRSDYVTNSSSSSFILSFKNEESVLKTLEEQFPKNIKPGWSAGEEGYLNQLINEINEARRLVKDEVEDIIAREDRYNWQIISKLEREKGMSYSEAKDFLRTFEGQQVQHNLYVEKVKSVMDKIGDDEVIVQVEHGDGSEGEDGTLEHEILQNLDCTVVRFSHH